MRALAHRMCEQVSHLGPNKRAANSAVLLTSCCALLLSLLLWANMRAGCSAEAISLAAGEGGEGRGLMGGLGGASGEGVVGFLEQQLKEQQSRVRELEMLLADERSEKQQVRFEKEELQREKEMAIGAKEQAERDREVLLGEAQSALYADSLVMGQYLKANRQALEAAWKARLAGQRQRGIVLSAGGITPMTNAFVTLHVLRHHLNCTLPAVLSYWGAAKADNVDAASQAFFKEHIPRLEFVDLSKLPYPAYHRPLAPEKEGGGFQGWKVKVFGIYSAPFQEVLYLDSDSTPLLDPAPLFGTQQYRQHGNLYWADFYAGDVPWIKAQKLFELLKVENPWGKEGSTARQTEAGQMLLNRAKHWDVLEWLLFLNSHDEVTYRTVHGDKDTFRAAFHLAGKPRAYQQVAHYPALTLTDTVVRSKRYHQRGVVQLSPNGTLLFHHRAGPLGKYDLARDEPNPAATHVTARASADLGTACVFSGSISNEAIGGMFEKQVLLVTPQTCNYSMFDWPAAQARCAPKYDHTAPGTTQLLPIFEVAPNSHLATAEAAADRAFALLQGANIWAPQVWRITMDNMR